VWRRSVDYVARSKTGIVAGLGDARAARLHAPAAGEHARRFLFGFAAPFTLMRVAWRDVRVRASMVDRLTIPVVLMAIATAMGIGSMVHDLVESRHHPAALAAGIDDADDDVAGSAHRAASDAAIAAALRAQGENKSATEVGSAVAEAATTAELSHRKEAAAASGRRGVLGVLARFTESRLAKIIAMLGMLEWILVWIIREHHDVITLEVSSLTGAPAEALPAPPRLRFDFGWLKLKAWRALRFLLFLALGSPPAWLLGAIPVVGAPLAGVWEAVWAAYWASVFAMANTFLAWDRPSEGDGAPWFVRALRAVGRVPVVGLPFRLYAALLAKSTRAVWPACIAFESAPWESTGLALGRLVAGIPVLYLVCRPMFPPAATLALLARRHKPTGT
jgi:hypothetical protein